MLEVFSKKLGNKVPLVETPDGIMIDPDKLHRNDGTRYSDTPAPSGGWARNGWANNSSTWARDGWSNGNDSWLREGWNASNEGWTREGWTNGRERWMRNGWSAR